MQWMGQVDPLAVIASGGSGLVLEARQDQLRRKLAVKVGHRHTKKASRDLMVEAVLTGRLEHPSVVPVHGLVQTADRRPGFAMKRVEGEHWGKALRDPSYIPEADRDDPIDWHVEVLLRVCEGMAYAHSRGVIHRDLKPSNIMVGRFGEVLIIDWGIALAVTTDGPTGVPEASTMTSIVGTPAYMAPETFPGDDRPGTASDIYQLGGLLYRAIGGGFPNGRGSVDEQMERARSGDRPWPPGAPEGLSAIARRALDPDPRQRHPSVESFRRALLDDRRRRQADPLIEAGRRKLDALKKHAAGVQWQGRKSTAGQRAKLYLLYGEAWFAWRQARRIDPDRAGIDQGLLETACALAQAEVASGRIVAADAALRSVEGAPTELKQEVARVRIAHDMATRETQALRADVASRSPLIGAERRMFMLVSLGLGWSASSAVLAITEGSARGFLAAESVVFGLLVLQALGFNSRRALSRFNRQTLVLLFTVLAGRLLTALAAMLMGTPPPELAVHLALISGVVATLAAIVQNPRLWPSALTFMAAGISGAVQPDTAVVGLVVASLLLTANFAYNGVVFLRMRRAGQPDRDEVDP